MTTAADWNLKRIEEKVNNIEARIYQLYDGSLKLNSNLFNHLVAEIEDINARIGDLRIDLLVQEGNGNK